MTENEFIQIVRNAYAKTRGQDADAIEKNWKERVQVLEMRESNLRIAHDAVQRAYRRLVEKLLSKEDADSDGLPGLAEDALDSVLSDAAKWRSIKALIEAAKL